MKLLDGKDILKLSKKIYFLKTACVQFSNRNCKHDEKKAKKYLFLCIESNKSTKQQMCTDRERTSKIKNLLQVANKNKNYFNFCKQNLRIKKNETKKFYLSSNLFGLDRCVNE
jgi:hypothetical protein